MSRQPIPAFAGELIQPGDPGYEPARRVWNRAIDRRPACIAPCASTEDVVRALAYARGAGLPVAVRGCGHSFAGFGVADGALVVDLSPMKKITVDPERQSATAQPGVTCEELDAATVEFGLATTGADFPSVGVSGYTLAGGTGWLHRVAGLSCDNLLSAQVVTAAGDVLRAAPDEHDDLFWALRGGGGNFGIVTSFEFRLHPLPEILEGIVLYPQDRAAEMLGLYQELCDCAPDELFLRAMLGTAPPAPFIPKGLRGRRVVGLIAAYFGPSSEGGPALRSLREVGTPAVELIRPLSYVALQGMFAAVLPSEPRVYHRSEFLTRLTDDVIESLVEGAADSPDSIATVNFGQLGGAMSRVPEGATAFSHRLAGHQMGVLGVCGPGDSSEPTAAWTRSMWERARPASAGGAYSANLGDDEGAERMRASYGTAYPRLARIKARYDAENFFRINANIEPDPGADGR